MLRKYLFWVDLTPTYKEVETFIIKCREAFENKTGADFGIWYEGAWVGSMGFHDIIMRDKKAAIGYWLGKEHQGKGIMTECVKAIIKYGFTELDLNRIEIECARINTQSRAIPEKLGFTLEGTLRDNRIIEGKFEDVLLFSLLRSEWKQ
jgi:ribosomal-protein-serine acetyltransferase